MANIIRCVLPDGVHRFKPFVVADYRDFLLVRNDMASKSEEEQDVLIDELTMDYFDQFPQSWRHYAFLQTFTGSVGKTKIPIVFECPTCGKKTKRLLNLTMGPLVDPELILDEDTKLIFTFPDQVDVDQSKMILDNIKRVVFKGDEYLWENLADETRDALIEMIDFEKFEDIIKRLKPFYFSLKLKCCDEHTIIYDDITSIFKLLINPDEVFPFYEINHILQKNNYSVGDIMKMLPAERSIALSLIEKDNKK